MNTPGFFIWTGAKDPTEEQLYNQGVGGTEETEGSFDFPPSEPSDGSLRQDIEPGSKKTNMRSIGRIGAWGPTSVKVR
jgi:hypothetical protein